MLQSLIKLIQNNGILSLNLLANKLHGFDHRLQKVKAQNLIVQEGESWAKAIHLKGVRKKAWKFWPNPGLA